MWSYTLVKAWIRTKDPTSHWLAQSLKTNSSKVPHRCMQCFGYTTPVGSCKRNFGPISLVWVIFVACKVFVIHNPDHTYRSITDLHGASFQIGAPYYVTIPSNRRCHKGLWVTGNMSNQKPLSHYLPMIFDHFFENETGTFVLTLHRNARQLSLCMNWASGPPRDCSC